MTRIWPNGGSSSPPTPGNGLSGQFQSTKEYGTDHELTGWHRGIDLINFEWIRAVADGKVVFSGHNGTAGYEIKIRHTDLTSTRYLHMEFGTLRFITGDTVKRGDIIGKMGASGYVTGKHLHFECIEPDGSTRINPRKYINPEVILGGGSTPFNPETEMNASQEAKLDSLNTQVYNLAKAVQSIINALNDPNIGIHDHVLKAAGRAAETLAVAKNTEKVIAGISNAVVDPAIGLTVVTNDTRDLAREIKTAVNK